MFFFFKEILGRVWTSVCACGHLWVCMANDEGGWRAWCQGLSDMWPGGLAGWLVCCLDGWLGTAQLKPGNSLSLSLSLPGVTGWDIKTGILINCATLPPAALNMLRPLQAVSHTTDSLALLLFHLPHLSTFPLPPLLSLTLFPIFKSDPSLLRLFSPKALFPIRCVSLHYLTLINENSYQ